MDNKELEKKVFTYLDELRITNVAGIYGARPYIESKFDLSENEAKELLMKWFATKLQKK